jgi:alkylation response protein AidB-like acyl-CoA dehydrogenase
MLADAAMRLFAVESATWRATGAIEHERLRLLGLGRPAAIAAREAFDEFATECSIVKVAASEMLDAVADHGVQIHGGYGYHADYFVERAYRDARINRIFEGTNEINRVLIPGMALKRRSAGRRPLGDLARGAFSALTDPEPPASAATGEAVVERLRALALAMLGAGLARFGDGLRDEQAVTIRIADAMIDTYLAESAALRAARLGQTSPGPAAKAAASKALVYARDALTRVARDAEDVLVATMGLAAARSALKGARALASTEPLDAIALRDEIAADSLGEAG